MSSARPSWRTRGSRLRLGITFAGAFLYGSFRAWQGFQGPPLRPEHVRWAVDGPFVDGVQPMALDAPGPCDDAERQRRLDARARFVVDNDAPGPQHRRVLPWQPPAIQLGDERGLAVVYVPCRGLYWMTPDAITRGRLPEGIR